MYNVILESTEPLAGAGLPGWAGWVITAIVAAIGAYLVPLLKQKAAAAKAEAEKLRIAGTHGSIVTREMLVEQLKAFLFDMAAAMAEKNFPELARKIKENNWEPGDVKKELKSWGATLRNEAIEHFEAQGVDIIAMVGDKYLDKLIEWAANKVSPFPGRETAVALLKDYDGKAIDWILNKGIGWVRAKMSRDAANGDE